MISQKKQKVLGKYKNCFKEDILSNSKIKKAFATLVLEMNNFWHDNLKDEFKK